MDEFKKHIQQRVNELDIDVPRDKVWQGINKQLTATKPNATLVYMKWAVAACIFALAGFGGYVLIISQAQSSRIQTVSNRQPTANNQQIIAKSVDTITQQLIAKVAITVSNKKASNISIETVKKLSSSQNTSTNTQALLSLQQVENTFTQVINLQKAKVNTTPLIAENPSYFNDFTIEMKRMERDEQTIKKDIRKSGLTDELLDQLINVYQQKLNMLKQLQNEIHKTNNRFKQNRGPVDSTKPYFLNI